MLRTKTNLTTDQEHFIRSNAPGVKNGFIKGEAITPFGTNSSKTAFEETLVKFKQRLRTRGEA